ncbi:MAG: methionyl-tRNA formyltransferase [Planctomycetota bacterium]
MDLLFFGSGAFGLPTLRALTERHAVRAIVSQPDRPSGRGKRQAATPIAEWAAEHAPQIALYKPDRVNEESIREMLRATPTQAWVVIAFGQKLGQKLLADRFSINLHASLLPRWRGAAPIHAAILGGDTETGNSVITLADRMDAGEVLGQSHRPIDPTLTAGEMHDLLAGDGPELVLDVLARFEAGTLEPQTQDESLVTLASKLSKGDGVLDFTQPAEALRRRVHGLTPWPGVAVALAGVRLKLLRVEPGPAVSEQAPGRLADPAEGLVSCGGEASLRLLEVQPAGKRAMPWSAFAAGRSIESGAALENPS